MISLFYTVPSNTVSRRDSSYSSYVLGKGGFDFYPTDLEIELRTKGPSDNI